MRMGARIVEALIGIGAFINKTTLNQERALIKKRDAFGGGAYYNRSHYETNDSQRRALI